MKRILILAVMTSSLAVEQEVKHAPTIDQCQADQRLWLSQIEADHGNGPLPGYLVIEQWWREMDDCMSVDPQNKVRYYNTESEAVVVQKSRLENFILRYQMWAKFMEEDEAGRR